MIDADPMPGARAGRLRRWLAPIARTFLLFLLVYLPAFAAVALFELEIDAAVPAIMGITTAMALLLVAILARRQHLTAGGFGLRGSEWRPLLRGLLLGLPLGLAATWAQHLTGEGSAGQDVPLTPGMSVLLFVVGASIQEELIFRGLLQTVLARNLAGALRVAGASISHAALGVAVLFGVIHLVVGPVTAAGAFVLGLLAGELRSRSGSLLPAMEVHALFNLLALGWTLV